MAIMELVAMADGSTNMAIRSIQWKSIKKLTQLCWLQLVWTLQSKVKAIWTLVVGAYIVSYNVKMFHLSKSYPHGFWCSNHKNQKKNLHKMVQKERIQPSTVDFIHRVPSCLCLVYKVETVNEDEEVVERLLEPLLEEKE